MARKPTNIEQEPKKYEPSVKNPPYSNTRGSTNSATNSRKENSTGQSTKPTESTIQTKSIQQRRKLPEPVQRKKRCIQRSSS